MGPARSRTRRTHPAWGLILVAAAVLLSASSSYGIRVKDAVEIETTGAVPVVGFGLVAGLDGSGDGPSTEFTVQSMRNMLDRMGIRTDSNRMRTRNVAAVMVTAELAPDARNGQKQDVRVAAIGDARSLRGGTLLLTQLQTPDGRVLATAQGSLTVGGYHVEGSNGSSQRRNSPTTGRVPGGGTVSTDLGLGLPSGPLHLTLREPDFTSAHNLALAIEQKIGPGSAEALDRSRIRVAVPPGAGPAERTKLVAQIESIEFQADTRARVVIDERTGTVVVGDHVTLGSAAVSHGALSIEIREATQVYQPAPWSQGTTQVTTSSETQVEEPTPAMVGLAEATTIQDVVTSLNQLGATPRELVKILEALHRAGALRAELVVL